MILMAMPLVICLILLTCLVPESPRYLVVSNKKKEALEALQCMAKINDVFLPEHLNIAVHSDQKLGSISDILKSDVRKETILLSVIYFVNLVVVFGTIVFVPLALYSGFCGGEGDPPVHECVEIQQDSLLQFSIVTFGSVLATGVGYIAAMKLGRSTSLKIFSTATGVGYIAAMKLGRSLKIFSTASFIVSVFLLKCFSNLTTVGLFFLIKLLQEAHNMVSLILIPDLYPTTFRNTAMGFLNGWGKLGGAVGAGAVYALYYYSPILVVTMFSGSALLVAVPSWIWNKETKNTVIMDVRDNPDVNSN